MSAISFGAWAIGGTWGPVDDGDSMRALHAGVDAGVNFVDSQGSGQLGKLVTAAERAGVSLRLARVKAEVLEVLEAEGVAQALGTDRFHPNLDSAVTTELAAGP